MHLVNLTTAEIKKIAGLFFSFFIYSISIAQDNSPYSRYGPGDIVPNQNIINRGMGGIAAGYSSYIPSNPVAPLNINFKNPASLGNISNTKNFSNTVFDIGGEIDFRTLKSTTVPAKYTSVNTVISYLQVAFPISTATMERHGTTWGLSFGIRPVTRIDYKIEKNERLEGIDSLNTLYEGTGGINQVNISTGLKIKNFSIGISSGYSFGTRDYSTQKNFINDTVTYYKSNTAAQSSFGGVFINTGFQYLVSMKKTGFLKLGGYVNLQQKLKAKQDNVNETFAFDGNGGILPIDTINSSIDLKGTIKLPATAGIGFTYMDKGNNWLFGADFEMTNWDSYRYYDQKDNELQNSWIIRAGAEYYPAKNTTSPGKYWSFVKYRAGVFFGPDYIKLDDKNRSNYAATLGASFPLTAARLITRGDYVSMNMAVEAGGRGNKESFSLKESSLKFCIGFTMNARWFAKKSYY